MKLRITDLSLLVILWMSTTSAQPHFSIYLMNGTATIKSDGLHKYVQVGWQTKEEKGFSYYTLQRSLPDSIVWTDSSCWRDITRIDTISTSDTIKTYTFTDYPPVVASYGYRLKFFLNDTPRVFLGIATIQAGQLTGVEALTTQKIPLEYGCVSNYPNPFNPMTTIVLKLQKAIEGSLDIFDLRGRKMESLAEGSLQSGVHRFQWNATKYPSGTYLCALRTRDHIAITKLVLQK